MYAVLIGYCNETAELKCSSGCYIQEDCLCLYKIKFRRGKIMFVHTQRTNSMLLFALLSSDESREDTNSPCFVKP
jgi:hypothetical protein